MKYTTIRIEGAILSADILDKIEQGDIPGQLPKDFGFDAKTKVKDEIARMKYVAGDQFKQKHEELEKTINEQFDSLRE